MLQLLKESVSSRHSERLEQIVIVLIAIEISMFSKTLFQHLSILTLPSSPWDHYYSCRHVCIIYQPEQFVARTYTPTSILVLLSTFSRSSNVWNLRVYKIH